MFCSSDRDAGAILSGSLWFRDGIVSSKDRWRSREVEEMGERERRRERVILSRRGGEPRGLQESRLGSLEELYLSLERCS
jgi:hypothetical protein